MGRTHLYETLIREYHLDTFGHVNHAEYLCLFEEARWEMLSENGYGLEQVQEGGIGPVVIEANVRFKKELTLRERVTISTQVVEYRRLVFKIHHELRNAKEQLCTEANLTLGFLDLKARKLVKPQLDWLRAIGWEENEPAGS